MTAERLHLRLSVVIVAAAGLLLSGAGISYVLLRGTAKPMSRVTSSTSESAASSPSRDTSGQPANAAAVDARAPAPDVAVPIAANLRERAGIQAAPVSSGGAAANGLRLPGVVEANGYRQVAVTALVAGRVTRVLGELGDRVRKGQLMAEVYSPEIAEAQARYIAARAELDAHERELQRTEKLVAIGAASRQELERIHAEHAAQTAAVQSSRSRLELLGVRTSPLDGKTPEATVPATASVAAPIAGVITERFANPGLNVDPAARLFTIVDLSSVWVVADLFEKDFSRVRVGSAVSITTAAFPGRVLQGRISYIDPQVAAATRTARLRVEVPNPRNELRLGMFADVEIAGATPAGAAVTVPRSAIQNVGDRQVVYVTDPKTPETFIEREVRVAGPLGDQVEVRSGLSAGDVVVTRGSFFVRAELERLGLRPSAGAAAPHASAHDDHAPSSDLQTARISVGAAGFEPARITLRAGVPARLTFVRTTDATCATEVVIPSLQITRPLPLNEPVVIAFTPAKGQLTFTCGMKMREGVVVIE
jgi:RND family efflux transporter MFP subunit